MEMTSPVIAHANAAPGWRFDNSYVRLPATLFARVHPAPVRAPGVVVINYALAHELGLSLETLAPDAAATLFAGQAIPDGADPIAQAYAGHQFGGFTMLGDGRAILLGEHLTPTGARVDIQFKGSGPTPFSRSGDGRAALGPMLREYIISEAMHALGIPTTRSLAVVTTGEQVYREDRLRGAVLTRVAASHLRVGTFQYLGAQGDVTTLRALADYAIVRHYPELSGDAHPYLALLRAVMQRQMALIARWQLVGFVHGVMNTDNMSIAGETIDYGPCAFMDRYHPETVFSSIDGHGRYAYDQQSAIANWNLARFAEALLPLFDAEASRAAELATAVLAEAPSLFEQAWLQGMRAKLGLTGADADDVMLVDELLAWMQETGADFTNTFRALSQPSSETPLIALPDDARFAAWRARWLTRATTHGATIADAQLRMRAANPAIIPRNHRVEAALAAAQSDDLLPLHRLLADMEAPYDERPRDADGLQPAPESAAHYRTFCGT
jgi:uncharacterized protein YdiU (UPF0061 family)